MSRANALIRGSAVRLTLGLVVVFALVSTLAWGATYVLVSRELSRLVTLRLTTLAEQVATARSEGSALPKTGVGQTIAIVAPEQGGAVADRGAGVHLRDGRHGEELSLVRVLPDGTRIVVTEDLERQEEMLETLQRGLVVSLLGAVLAALAAGAWGAWRAQRRLERIGEGLAQVSDGDLSTRIALPGPRDDLADLADRINATTARLETAMDQMRVQTSNIAHDLRTPLARLRAGLERALIDQSERKTQVPPEVLSDALEQIDGIVATFNALLRLARIERGTGRDAFQILDMADLLGGIIETFAPVVEDAGHRLRLDIRDPQKVWGDRDLVVQLVANLLQNALHYGAPGQEIVLGLRGRVVSVADGGPGIPAGERDKVLRPLYRLDTARQTDGAGLGLAMVSAIAGLHAAQLRLSNAVTGRGLLVEVAFPNHTKL